MAAFAPTDWNATDVQVLRSSRPWGVNQGREVLAKLTFHTNGASLAGLTYPSDGLPVPAPSLLGMRETVEYVIPLGPFTPAAYPASIIYPWQAMQPATGTPTRGARIRLTRYKPATALSQVVTDWEFTTGGVTLIAPTTATSGLVGYLIAVGK